MRIEFIADKTWATVKARQLKAILSEQGIRLNHQTALHVLAKFLGYDNQNAFLRAIENGQGREDDRISSATQSSAPLAGDAAGQNPPASQGPLRINLWIRPNEDQQPALAFTPEPGFIPVYRAGQLCENGSLALHLFDTPEQARRFERELSLRAKAEGILSLASAIDGYGLVLEERVEEFPDEPAAETPSLSERIEIRDRRGETARTKRPAFVMPAPAKGRGLSVVEDVSGASIDVTDDILSMTADDVRALCARWSDRHTDPGDGWPFRDYPGQVDATLRSGGSAYLVLTRFILDYFGIAGLGELRDEHILARRFE